MRELGYVDGQNISIEYRFAEGKPERLADLAADLVRLKPNVLFPVGGDVAPFVSKATQTIPIVFVMSADPLQLGLVASVARPGGNTTGFTFLQDELASKRLELFKEVAPRISRVSCGSAGCDCAGHAVPSSSSRWQRLRRTSAGLPSWSPGHHRSPFVRCVSVASVSKVERKSPAQSSG